MDQRYNLFIFEHNKNVADSLVEILNEYCDLIVTTFSSCNESEIKRMGHAPDVIIYNIDGDFDINFLSGTVVRYFNQASVFLMIDAEAENKLLTMPIFKKIYFLYKPFPINLLFERIISTLSELIMSNEQEIILGGGAINLKNKSLRNDNGDSVYFTDKENQLLKLLIEANPGGVAKGKLLQNVWGYAENVKTSTLETHIYRLRKKISHVLGDTDLIVFRGGGYKINF